MKLFFLGVLAALTLAAGPAKAQLELQSFHTGAMRQQVVAPVIDITKVEPDTIVISIRDRQLYYKKVDGSVVQYPVGVGRDGFRWSGTTKVVNKAKWPDWVPPPEMRKRELKQRGLVLPERMEGGRPDNPVGARALYLDQPDERGQRIYRIHGTHQPHTVGRADSSGCFRMYNTDVMDLYEMVQIGTKVVVLP